MLEQDHECDVFELWPKFVTSKSRPTSGPICVRQNIQIVIKRSRDSIPTCHFSNTWFIFCETRRFYSTETNTLRYLWINECRVAFSIVLEYGKRLLGNQRCLFFLSKQWACTLCKIWWHEWNAKIRKIITALFEI